MKMGMSLSPRFLASCTSKLPSKNRKCLTSIPVTRAIRQRLNFGALSEAPMLEENEKSNRRKKGGKKKKIEYSHPPMGENTWEMEHPPASKGNDKNNNMMSEDIPQLRSSEMVDVSCAREVMALNSPEILQKSDEANQPVQNATTEETLHEAEGIVSSPKARQNPENISAGDTSAEEMNVQTKLLLEVNLFLAQIRKVTLVRIQNLQLEKDNLKLTLLWT